MEWLVRKVDDKRFDVFEGNQWGHLDGNGEAMDTSNTWSRLKAGKHGVYVTQGRSLTHALTKALAKAIDPSLNQQFITIN